MMMNMPITELALLGVLPAEDSQEAAQGAAAASAPAASQGPETPKKKQPVWGIRQIKAGQTTFADTIEASPTLERQLEEALGEHDGPVVVADSPK